MGRVTQRQNDTDNAQGNALGLPCQKAKVDKRVERLSRITKGGHIERHMGMTKPRLKRLGWNTVLYPRLIGSNLKTTNEVALREKP